MLGSVAADEPGVGLEQRDWYREEASPEWKRVIGAPTGSPDVPRPGSTSHRRRLRRLSKRLLVELVIPGDPVTDVISRAELS